MTGFVRRYFRGPHLVWAQATRLLADDDRGLLLWMPVGAAFTYRVDGDGRRLRAAPTVDAYGAAPFATGTWAGYDVLLLHPPGAAHSVWWFFSAAIRAEGDRVVADIEAARFPFDGTWCDFAPESWPPPTL